MHMINMNTTSNHSGNTMNQYKNELLIDPGEDEIIEDNFEDSRVELQCIGHNLVCVFFNDLIFY